MRLRSLLAATIVVLLTAGCASGNDRATTPDPRLFGGWQLKSATDSQGVAPLGPTNISLTIDDSGTAHGRGACNDYTARIVGSLGAIFVATAKLSNTAPCTARSFNDLDSRYLRDLLAIGFAEVQGDALTLRSRSVTLRYARAEPLPLDAIINTVWVAQSLSALGMNTAFEQHPYNVTLLLSRNGRFLISTACPAITGRWREDAGEIVFFGVTGLHAPCSDIETTHRYEIFDVLGNGFTVDKEQHTLFVANPRQRQSLLFAG